MAVKPMLGERLLLIAAGGLTIEIAGGRATSSIILWASISPAPTAFGPEGADRPARSPRGRRRSGRASATGSPAGRGRRPRRRAAPRRRCRRSGRCPRFDRHEEGRAAAVGRDRRPASGSSASSGGRRRRADDRAEVVGDRAARGVGLGRVGDADRDRADGDRRRRRRRARRSTARPCRRPSIRGTRWRSPRAPFSSRISFTRGLAEASAPGLQPFLLRPRLRC